MNNNDDSIFLNYKKQVQNAIKDLKTKGRRHRQIPNLLTLLRLTAPCFIIPTAIMGNVAMIIGLTAFFSFTDLADGLIARKYHLTSELGATLDAVTDKIFASTLLLAASFTNPILLCNLGLEATVAGINTYKKLNNKPVKSSIIGKLKTWFLFSLVGVGIASPYYNINSILNTLMVSTTVMQVFTIGSYLSYTTINKELEQKEQNKSDFLTITNAIEQKKVEKVKVLEKDNSSKTQRKDESLKQLKAIRASLILEQMITESEIEKNNSKSYEKSKKDDFKNN